MTGPSLLDDFMPRWDVRERHATHVPASADDVYAALHRADLGRPLVVRLLVGLRALPAAAAAMRRGERRTPRTRTTLRDIRERGFHLIAESPPRELLLGLEGRFWSADGCLRRDLDATSFRGPIAPGAARGAWSFVVTPHADGGCELATETRVRCADASARRRFLPYWFVIRPWSGLIRRVMLGEIRRHAVRS